MLAVGGGPIGPELAKRFIQLAGGPDALIVVIPTAGTRDDYDENGAFPNFLRQAGARNFKLLHTRDRAESDTPEFNEPLTRAGGVWFGGGRQWRLVDSYLNTRTHRELVALLERGGIIGGSSAGATIQGSYLVRGAREGNELMMAPGYEEGLGFLRGVGIDQHWMTRGRQRDMIEVIEAHPDLLGIGIDESTAILVLGDRLEVIGRSKVGIYENRFLKNGSSNPYRLLSPGDLFDLGTRTMIGP